MHCAVRDRILDKNGFTIIEMIVVISIIAIIGAIAIPSFIGYTEKAKKEVCKVNCLQLERMYETYLTMEELEHSEVLFTQYLHEYGKNICPGHGDINYVDGKVQCSKHDRDEGSGSDDKEDESVPFL